MKFSSSALFCALVALQDVDALRLGLRGWTRSSPATFLRRRDQLSGLDDKSNMRYYTNLTLNGQTISAQIDTGSSDLYVAGTIPGATSTGKTTSITYASGSVEGSVKTAALEFVGFSIPDQAYLEIPPSSSDAENTGLIGLGPHVGSSVYYALNKNPSGDPPLDRIFRQNTSTPNYLTVLLGRSDDPDEKFPGDLTIGELIPGYENITNQPKLAIADVVASDAGSQHWATLLDENGISSNGTIISLPKSQVAKPADSGKELVVFDTGFSLPQLPRSVVDAIYQDIPGAKFYNDTSVGPIYALPCDQEIDLTFYFGGQPYPIHPLDTNLDGSQLNLMDDNGNPVCIGAFQPVSFDASFGSGEAPDFDMILGMAWLRNAYLYVNMGDFIDGSNNTADPYLQLLSITNDTAKAQQDFIQVRAGGNFAAAANAEEALGKSSSRPTVTSSKKKKPLSKVSKILIAVVIAGIIMLVLFGVLVWCCCCRNRGKRSANTTAAYPGSSYQPLHVPAPDAATDAHGAPHATSYGYQEYTPYGSAPPLQSGYQTPYSKEY
ncbi:hypothetical protein PILCRDRAFT_60964 [Piloderma croceum F 1598]|uniref:Peptidase A1 domain-containing protein n=1 Tax=Piloderma croceum (strain F 1598) TaxID=765440 RepID=A0A0C3FYU2_PILCF|nr:hypothetical protein PILCRDRAFT_60964 [Piloderma croceum F 1598]